MISIFLFPCKTGDFFGKYSPDFLVLMEIILAILATAILGILVWDRFLNPKTDTAHLQEKLEKIETEKAQLIEENARLHSDIDNKNRELGKTTELLQQERSERDKLEGRGKQIFVELTNLQNEVKSGRTENAELKKRIAEFEAQEKQKDSAFEEKIKKLEHAQKSLEDERQRIRREDEERQQEILEEQNRIWNDHENIVLSRLREVCQRPEIGFGFYDNNSLPTEFDGSVKPDFLVEFLDQYIIFDAKFTSQKNPNTYFADQVKKTAKKCKGNDSIYSVIFFVVPENRIAEIKKFSFYEDGYSFFVIPQSAIEPLLANFKKITEYERISEFDPQDRENIVNLVAHYDRHISFQNATNILLAKESVGLMESKDSLNAELQDLIRLRKQSMRPVRIKESDIKKLTQNLDAQEAEMEKLISPRASVEKPDLDSAQNLFESLSETA
jgi:hypothetical protein